MHGFTDAAYNIAATRDARASEWSDRRLATWMIWLFVCSYVRLFEHSFRTVDSIRMKFGGLYLIEKLTDKLYIYLPT